MKFMFLKTLLFLCLLAHGLCSSSLRAIKISRPYLFNGEHVILDEDSTDGTSPCLSVDFMMPFNEPLDFNMSEGVGPIKDETANLQCHCADRRCECTGSTPEDCDEYAQGWLYFIGTAHQIGGVLYKMAKYNVGGTIYWLVCGGVLVVVGAVMLVYMELRAVLCVRQRDERGKLEALRAMEKSARLRALEQEEAGRMRPRAYVTLTGAGVLWLGLLCQMVPFCHLLRELGLPVAFPGWCLLFVAAFSLTLAAASALLLTGCCWSCTRPVAAVFLLLLGLAGDVALLQGGLWACAVWAAAACLALGLYFVWLPAWCRQGPGPEGAWDDGPDKGRPWWLEAVGGWSVPADVDAASEALRGAGDLLAHDLAQVQARKSLGYGAPSAAPAQPAQPAQPA